jgi:hypothetical protein
MKTDDIIAAILLFIAASVLYTVGLSSILFPRRVRDIGFKVMDFWHQRKLGVFYHARKRMMSGSWFLIYLRAMGVVVIIFAIISSLAFISKVTGIHTFFMKPR